MAVGQDLGDRRPRGAEPPIRPFASMPKGFIHRLKFELLSRIKTSPEPLMYSLASQLLGRGMYSRLDKQLCSFSFRSFGETSRRSLVVLH